MTLLLFSRSPLLALCLSPPLPVVLVSSLLLSFAASLLDLLPVTLGAAHWTVPLLSVVLAHGACDFCSLSPPPSYSVFVRQPVRDPALFRHRQQQRTHSPLFLRETHTVSYVQVFHKKHTGKHQNTHTEKTRKQKCNKRPFLVRVHSKRLVFKSVFSKPNSARMSKYLISLSLGRSTQIPFSVLFIPRSCHSSRAPWQRRTSALKLKRNV